MKRIFLILLLGTNCFADSDTDQALRALQNYINDQNRPTQYLPRPKTQTCETVWDSMRGAWVTRCTQDPN
jgi:hypothetical protein